MQVGRPILRDVGVAVAYFAAAWAVLTTTRFDGGVAFIWVATAILISYLTLRPRRVWLWPMLLCGITGMIATGLFGLGWAKAVPLAVINLGEAYIGAAVLARVRSDKAPLGSLIWMWQFSFSVGLVAPFAASIAAAALLGSDTASALATFRNFFVGHALGNVTFIPLISLALGGHLKLQFDALSRRRRIETSGLLLLVAVVTFVSFRISDLPLLFLPCGPVILAIFRGRQIGAAMSIVIVAVIGGGMTIAGHGPIQMIDSSIGARVQFFQFYLAAVVLTALPLAGDLRIRARLHRALRESEERYRLLAELSTDIVMHTAKDGTIRYVSPAIRTVGGYEPEELVGTSPAAMIEPDHHHRVHEAHWATLAAAGRTHSFEFKAITKSGEKRWFETHSRAVSDGYGRPESVLSFIRDITARKLTEARLSAEAATDALTGLPNRRAFRSLAAAILADERHGEVAIAMVDIDHFKSVNDCFGHDTGDQVLRSFARLARGLLRKQDVFARIGGEEFAIIFPGLSESDAAAVCDRIRERVAANACDTSLGPIAITISGGVTSVGGGGLDEALKRADAALYQAKQAGRDRLMRAA